MYRKTRCSIALLGLLFASHQQANATDESNVEADAPETQWIARGSIGRLFFTDLGDIWSNDAKETTTLRLEAARTFKGFSIGLLGQFSHVNGVYWEVQSGPTFTQGDSLILQLGVSGRYERALGPVVLGVYADLTATGVPLLMNREWYEEQVAELHTDTIHKDNGQFIGHVGLGTGTTLGIPIYQTGVSAEAQVGLQWISEVDLAIQTQLGLSATF